MGVSLVTLAVDFEEHVRSGAGSFRDQLDGRNGGHDWPLARLWDEVTGAHRHLVRGLDQQVNGIHQPVWQWCRRLGLHLLWQVILDVSHGTSPLAFHNYIKTLPRPALRASVTWASASNQCCTSCAWGQP